MFLGDPGQWYVEYQHPRGPGGRWISKGGQPESATEAFNIRSTRTSAVDIYEAIDHYVNLSHYFVNSYLREGNKTVPKGSPNEEDCQNTIRLMDAGFANPDIVMKTKKAMIVYRGIGDDKVFNQLKKAKGKTITDKGYLSTSESEEIAGYGADQGFTDKKIILGIKVPKGTPYLPGRGEEDELIFNRGSSYKIKGVSVSGDTMMVTAELQPFEIEHIKPTTTVQFKEVKPDKYDNKIEDWQDDDDYNKKINHDDVIAFHGTSAQVVDSIIKQGFKTTGTKTFGEAAAAEERGLYADERSKATFVTKSSSDALEWGSSRVYAKEKDTHGGGGEVAIFKLSIPPDAWQKMQSDKAVNQFFLSGDRSRFSLETIPPQWIMEYRIYRERKVEEGEDPEEYVSDRYDLVKVFKRVH